ncbi:MAG: hypothetical protein M0Z99_12235 [Betaproteobacteria bacterium]|nr:hypothetical protein [Betaproteobacteria bacterium]
MHDSPACYGAVTILLQFIPFEPSTAATSDRNPLKAQCLITLARFSRMERQPDAQITNVKLLSPNQIHPLNAYNAAQTLLHAALRRKLRLQSMRSVDAAIAREILGTIDYRLPKGNFTTPVDARYSAGPVGQQSRHLSCYVLSIDADQETDPEANYSAATKRSGSKRQVAQTLAGAANRALKCVVE